MMDDRSSETFSRLRWSADEGRRAVEAWRSSGLSRRQWCMQSEVPLNRLSYWSRRLAVDSQAVSASDPSGFIPVVVEQENGLRVCVADGVATMQVGWGFDARLLRAVVEALR